MKKPLHIIFKAASLPHGQTVQSYSRGGANVTSHEGTLAPPREYDWTSASFGPPKSTTQTANWSVQPFYHSSRHKVPNSLYFTAGAPFPQNCPFPWRSGPHITQDSLGPSEPTTQTAYRSVQPFLYRWPQSVPVLYNGTPLPGKCHMFHRLPW